MYLVLMHRFAPNLVGNIYILRKYVDLTLVLIGLQVAQVCHILLEFDIFLRPEIGLPNLDFYLFF